MARTMTLGCLIMIALIAVPRALLRSGDADDEQTSPLTGGLAEGNRVPVSIARFVVHPGTWRGKPIVNGCPSRMYRETTAIAVHARSPEPELFHLLESLDLLADAADPLPTDPPDTELRVYALVFQPTSVSSRSDDDRTALQARIASLVEEHGISQSAIGVSNSAESRDLDRFGFDRDDDVVIVLSERGIVRYTSRLSWDDITEEGIADAVSAFQQLLDRCECPE